MALSEKTTNLLKTLGPGIMFAGTCIGGSHLVQSTKAGAFYGFGLLSIVLIANLFKYPFFEFASRYTNATGDSILEGYNRVGRWTLVLYAIITVVSMFVINAAIGALTGGLANNLFHSITGISSPIWVWPMIIFTIVFGVLSYGRFGVLDKILKVIGVILVLTTVVAFFSVIFKMPPPKPYEGGTFSILSNSNGLMFAIALMGWMPIAVDMSSWHSLWTQERIKQTGYHPTLKETLTDFNLGYGITVFLAFFFLTIGAYVLYQNPQYTQDQISNMSGLSYAKTLVDMFSEAVGPWSYYIISVAAFSTMLGTSITLIDGYCRAIERTFALLRGKHTRETFHKKSYLTWVATLLVGSFLIILYLVSSLGQIVNAATIVSFIIAPFAAILNFKIMFNPEVPDTHKPNMFLKALAVAGIVFLSVFTVIYLVQIL
jgi:Mn2+/Fe2+ NRAMP family transporter